jgi:plastocyanin domain-containing protein
MTTLVVNLIGIAAMAAIVWWFWLWKPDNTSSDNQDPATRERRE